MTKRSVDDMYGGRSFPHGRVRDGANHRVESEPAMESASARDTAFNKNTNQAPEDQHSPGYSNDVANDWRRGGGVGGATGKPGFDKGQSYRRSDRGDNWNSGHDPAIIRKPERNVP